METLTGMGSPHTCMRPFGDRDDQNLDIRPCGDGGKVVATIRYSGWTHWGIGPLWHLGLPQPAVFRPTKTHRSGLRASCHLGVRRGITASTLVAWPGLVCAGPLQSIGIRRLPESGIKKSAVQIKSLRNCCVVSRLQAYRCSDPLAIYLFFPYNLEIGRAHV